MTNTQTPNTTEPPSKPTNKPCAVELRDVVCTFQQGQTTIRAVDHVSLQIQTGEFFSMLGPSGSGKTTCLRLIGGFEKPNTGHVLILGKDASALPPHQRDVNTVFQDYALFPHLCVRDNVAYGPMVRGVDKRTRHHEAERLLEMVKLGGLGDRKPAQLSGGQRQRVALARALINKPKVLLLDEPLGALDLKLREEMQLELKQLQRNLGITFVYVTHDQSEALSMSDRVAVFNAGKIEQLETPQTLYAKPRSVFVARFVGSANVLPGALLGLDTQKHYALRPEHLSLCDAAQQASTQQHSTQPTILGQLQDVHFLGAQTRLEVHTEAGRVTATFNSNPNTPLPKLGETLHLAWQAEHAHALEDKPLGNGAA